MPKLRKIMTNPTDSKQAAITFLETDRPDLIAFQIKGKPSEQEIKALSTDFLRQIESFEQIDLLVRIADFDGFPAAILADSSLYKLKKEALKRLHRYAVINPPGWMAPMVKAANPFISAEVKTFKLTEEQAAWDWIKS